MRKRAEISLQMTDKRVAGISVEETRILIHDLNAYQIELEMQNEKLNRAQEEIEIQRDRYSDLYDFAPIGYVTLAEQNTIIEANLCACEMLGVNRKSLYKQRFLKYIATEDQNIYYQSMKLLLETLERQSCELRIRKNDGKQFYAQLALIVKSTPKGNQLRISLLDISEHKKAEEKIADLARFPAENTNPVFRVAKDMTLLYHNQAGIKLLGQDAVEPGSEIPKNWHETLQQVWDSGETSEVEVVLGKKTILFSRVPIKTRGYINLYATDITELKKQELELQKMQRLESIGQLAGGIAHDFNNLLGGILGNIDLAREFLDDNVKSSKYLDEALVAFQKASELTEQLLTFSKGGKPSKTIISLNKLLTESKEHILRGANIKCEITISHNLPAVLADSNQLSQVFNNILANARQAMPSGGTIEVLVKKRDLSSYQITGLRGGSYVEVLIKDEGPGIPKSLLPNVFDLFFTTKNAGSGLGLAICHSILCRHDGAIIIDSQVNKGTTVSTYLPLPNQDISEISVIPEQAEETIAMGMRILVMDDEEVMLNVAKGILQILGLETICTRNGREAIEVFQKEFKAGRPFNLVLLDLTVAGGIGGEQAMAEIRKLDPGIIGIVTSGYANSPILPEPENYGFAEKLEKPYSKNELLKTIERALKKN